MAAAELATIGALIADPTRAEILCALMDGRAHTGGELARHVAVSPSTVSEHMSKLLDAALVCVEAQGRHRYFRLASLETAELLEMLGAVSTPATPKPSRSAAALAHARTCYDHLAGEVAIGIYDHLVENHLIFVNEGHATLSEHGTTFFSELGVDVPSAQAATRPTLRPCLDWTERRHHLAGALGASLLDTMIERRWVRRGQRPRSIRVTGAGSAALIEHFGFDG